MFRKPLANLAPEAAFCRFLLSDEDCEFKGNINLIAGDSNVFRLQSVLGANCGESQSGCSKIDFLPVSGNLMIVLICLLAIVAASTINNP